MTSSTSFCCSSRYSLKHTPQMATSVTAANSSSRSLFRDTTNRRICDPRRTRIEYGLFTTYPFLLARLTLPIEDRPLLQHQHGCDDVAKYPRGAANFDALAAGDIAFHPPGDSANRHLHFCFDFPLRSHVKRIRIK